MAVFLVVRPAGEVEHAWSPDGVAAEEYAAALVDATNAARSEEGLAPLTVSDCATAEALARATALAGGKDLEHESLSPVIEACPPSSSAAENLARAAAPPLDVVDAWLGSAGHRANLLDPSVREVGIGCLVDEDEMLCSQVFLGE
ncbi:CAP domain-containing protein [Cellulomonas xylanilytica]|uniref:CAP domain-containing protein n=1 Tax=Cellulomonas xylanilytica TaxID=233583 RepID=UPI001649EFBF|nr:CAP domain-containing protein [Cellulomonas xylanilytica]